MLKIGLDKTDKNFRHFEYDDERRYGNPQVFKVLYEETGDFGEVMCSNVISIKKSNKIHNHFLDIPIYNENKKDDVSNCETYLVDEYKTLVDEYKTFDDAYKTESVPEEKKKTKTSKSKTKSKSVPLTGKTADVKEVSLEINHNEIFPKSYDYDVLTIDNISYVDDIKSKLNEYGKNGWEVCGFQAVNKLFGCQIIIIMKKGLN